MLNQQQRQVLAGKLMDLGNLALGSLVFGVVIRSDIVGYVSLLLGVVVAIVTYGFAITLEK